MIGFFFAYRYQIFVRLINGYFSLDSRLFVIFFTFHFYLFIFFLFFEQLFAIFLLYWCSSSLEYSINLNAPLSKFRLMGPYIIESGTEFCHIFSIANIAGAFSSFEKPMTFWKSLTVFLWNLTLKFFRNSKWVLYMEQGEKPFWRHWKTLFFEELIWCLRTISNKRSFNST